MLGMQSEYNTVYFVDYSNEYGFYHRILVNQYFRIVRYNCGTDNL
jgi:hypothetical protein